MDQDLPSQRVGPGSGVATLPAPERLGFPAVVPANLVATLETPA